MLELRSAAGQSPDTFEPLPIEKWQMMPSVGDYVQMLVCLGHSQFIVETFYKSVQKVVQ